ncbi:MAG: trimeric intracellular cation channel family protein [Prevotellaceae bacterium]|nr:trimeric intracellular cation channel family protein [Prevotellaceae bacterium]
MEETLLYTILDYIGSFAFAISGTRLAAAKHFDLFGAYVVGLVTAIGGGTIRDVLLDITPCWMTNPAYLTLTAIALIWVIVFRKQLVTQNNTWFLFDAIGLALFTVTGLNKSLMTGFPVWVAIIMGTMTGAAGGVLRDILLNEIPLIFRRDIYAMACIVGGFVFWLLYSFGCDKDIAAIICGITVLATRLLAVKFHISLPVLKGEE